MRENGLSMEESFIEDMTMVDGETQASVDLFMNHLEKNEKDLQMRIDKNEKTGGSPLDPDSFYFCVRNAYIKTFGGPVLKSAFYCFIGECCAIGFTTTLIFLINYIKDPDAPFQEGMYYLLAFGGLMFTSVYCKNTFIWTG